MLVTSDALLSPPRFFRMYDAVVRQGLYDSNLSLLLDIADRKCWTGDDTNQTMIDLSTAGYNHCRGENNIDATADPTTVGHSGSNSRGTYFACSNQWFSLAGTGVPANFQAFHKDNATFTMAAWIYLVDLSASQSLCGDSTGGLTDIGFLININITTGLINIRVANGSGSALALNQTSSTVSVTPGKWSFVALSLDEAVGSNGLVWQVDGDREFGTSTYSSPSAASASPEQWGICNRRRVSASSPFVNGSRLSAIMFWTRALSSSELTKLYETTKLRYQY